MNKLSLIAAAGLVAVAVSSANAVVVFSDSFGYATGPIVGATGSPWLTASGTALQVDVGAGVVNLTTVESEDVGAPLTGGPFTTGTLYASAIINLSALPTGTTYFLHFGGTAVDTNFRGRVHATITGAAVGSFRFGIGDTTSTIVSIPTDLSLNTNYNVVVAQDTATGRSTLYLNPNSEIGGTVATDTTSAIVAGIGGIRLRQSAGIGILTIDDLVVGTTFADVVIPEPTTLGLIAAGSVLALRRRK